MKHIRKIIQDQGGTSVTEFGLIAPTVMIMMLGALDLGHSFYVNTIINGSMQDLARDSSLEGSSQFAQQRIMDEKITEAVKNVSPNATVTVTRRYYKTFTRAAAAKAEDWTDDNANGVCDNNEPYVDQNVNSVWDADGGDDGQGGARDVVIMKINVTYPRMFPMAGLLGWKETVDYTSDSILANQPYGEQSQYSTAVIRNCS